MSRIGKFLFAALAVALLVATRAEAGNTRSFVSGQGSDTNSCTLSAPCRTFAQAITQTNPGGEITVLNSAGYGSVIIDRSITITNPGGVEAGITASNNQDAITINAGPFDVVNLHGLTLIGGRTGHDGILFNTGGTLNMQNCTITGFSNVGIAAVPQGSSKFHISDTIVSASGAGFVFQPSANTPIKVRVLLKRTQSLGNDTLGYYFDGASAVGGLYDFTSDADDAIAADNGTDGFRVETTPGFSSIGTSLMLRKSQSIYNNIGIHVIGGEAYASISDSSFVGNLFMQIQESGGNLHSFGNNTQIFNNNNNNGFPGTDLPL